MKMTEGRYLFIMIVEVEGIVADFVHGAVGDNSGTRILYDDYPLPAGSAYDTLWKATCRVRRGF
jgi:hypothetical protein